MSTYCNEFNFINGDVMISGASSGEGSFEASNFVAVDNESNDVID